MPSREARYTLGGVLLAAALGALYSSLSLDAVLRHGMDWPMRLRHGDSVSLATYGKWWIHAPHGYVTDALSGAFPAFYNYLSDTLLNLLATLSGWAPMTLQSVFWGPLMGFLFVIGAFFALRRVLPGPGQALAASALLAFGANSRLALLFSPGLDALLSMRLHVPFHALPLANAQALGWVLFTPAVVALYLAVNRRTKGWAALNGVLFGVLFHAHTLTFIHVAVMHLFYLGARTARSAANREIPRSRLPLLAGGAGTLALAFAIRAWLLPTPMGLPFLGALWIGAMGLCFYAASDRSYYWRSYLPSLAIAAPYAAHLARNARRLEVHFAADPGIVRLWEALVFFFPLWVTAALAARAAWRSRDRQQRELATWGAALLASCLFLGADFLWNWPNHPYRFMIHLIFPLSLFAPMGLRAGPRWLTYPLGAWVGSLLLLNAQGFLLRRTLYAGNLVESAAHKGFYDKIAVATTIARSEPGSSILMPPEFQYPDALTSMARILSYSRIPGFLPDYRYVLQPERYLNRLGIFCSLFPGYPINELDRKNESCLEPLAPSRERDGFALREPRLRASLYPLYGIRFVASLDTPLGERLAPGSLGPLGLRPIATIPGGVFAEALQPALPGVARIERGAYDARGFHATFTIDAPGRQRLILGGRGMRDRADRVEVDGAPAPARERSASSPWATYALDLPSGTHTLDLPWTAAAGAHWRDERDYLSFVNVIREAELGRYIDR